MGYTDADWEGDLDERKSTSGYVFLLNNGVISWSSKKHSCISLSTMEAEFVAFSAAVQVIARQQSLIQKIPSIIQKPNTLILSIISLETW
jgi:hypothetical protein